MEQTFVLRHKNIAIPCILDEPGFGTIEQVVLCVHGFGGSYKDTIQQGIAEEMAMFGAATMRFDFPAHGENPEESLTLSGCVETLMAVAGEVKRRYPGMENPCIFASGFGAYVTLVALEMLQEMLGHIRLVVQTPSVRMDQTLLAMIHRSKETFAAMERMKLLAPRPFDVTYSFYEELHSHVVMVDHGTAMLILHGEADEYIRMEDIRNFARINEQAKLVLIPGTTHQFLEEGAWDMVLDLTRDWFASEQVWLSDWE